MDNVEAIKILENIEQEIAPEQFSTVDEYLTAYQRRFIEVFGPAKNEEPQAVKEARDFLEIGIINPDQQDARDGKLMDFTYQKKKKQLLKHFMPAGAVNQPKAFAADDAGFIEMEVPNFLQH